MPLESHPSVVVRPATAYDVAACAAICFEAFRSISEAHGFPCDFPHPDATLGVIGMMFSHPDSFYAVVAEYGGRVVGSNILDERSVICGVGPITVDPAVQNLGVGRLLMQAVMERAAQRNALGVRLVQAPFHNRSLSLYTRLGFDVREPLACMRGQTRERTIPGCTVRPATPNDLPACNAIAHRVHGFDRGADLAQSIHQGTALVVERAGRVTGYSSHLAFFGHSTAETTIDLQAIIASVDSFAGPGILVPSRNSELFRWCLDNGLRVVQPLTLMSYGFYNEPSGAFLPSILF
jgi:predicted N-acetyltransferase YhbS